MDPKKRAAPLGTKDTRQTKKKKKKKADPAEDPKKFETDRKKR